MRHVTCQQVISRHGINEYPALSAIAKLLLQLLLCLVLHTVYLMACNVVEVYVARAMQLAARTPSKVHITTRYNTLQHTGHIDVCTMRTTLLVLGSGYILQ